MNTTIRSWGKFIEIDDPEFIKQYFGSFIELNTNIGIKQKLLYVDGNKAISLQFHNKRSEIWKVLSETATVQIEDKICEYKLGDVIEIKQKQIHRLFGPSTIAEVWLFDKNNPSDEEDIVRLSTNGT